MKKNKTNIFNYPAKKYSSWIFDETLKYQKQYGFDIGKGEHATWNNESDAFKHAFMQAHLSLLFGKKIAKVLGDKHEKDGNIKMGQQFGEFNMDNWNNEQGRQIAKEMIRERGIGVVFPSKKNNDIIAQKVIERMNKGQLITSPNDKRKFTQRQSTGYAAPVEDTINQNNFKSHTTFTPESLVGGNSSRSYTTFTPESLVGGNSSRSYTTFTPEEIGRMSPQEFARNEKAIMQQLKNGQIKPSSVPNVDFKSFKNPENGKSTIFTREDIEKMSTKEFTKNEKAINAQMKSVGIPYKKEVPTGTTTYTKEKAKTAASSSSNSSTDGNGRWVTINGNHVFLEKEK
ncbi:MAG: hypothetical protein E7Z87_01705 [Cyanobacteria bacterium SIG26]|nr:hypothetical protein [Cyanobacteria bacterium SIG26]